MGKRISPYLVLSTHCNMNCTYCYVDKVIRERQYDYDRAALDAVDTFIYKVWEEEYEVGRITLHGSENTILSPEIFAEVLNRLSTVTGNIKMTTNGQNLGNKEYFDIFIQCYYGPLTAIGFTVSIDGPEVIHNMNRPNSYGNAINAIKNLQSVGIRCSTLGVVTKTTIDYFDEFKGWFQYMKQTFGIIPFMQHVTGNSYEDNNVKMKFTKWLMDSDNLVNNLSFNINVLANKGNECNLLVLDLNGAVYGCNKHYGKSNAIGNWFTSSFDEILLIRRGLFKQKNYEIHEECKTCNYFNMCFGGCPAVRVDGKAHDCFIKKYVYSRQEVCNAKN